jgi:hypothetical protein
MALTSTPIAAGSAIPIIPQTAGSGAPSLSNVLLLGFGSFVATGATAVTVADAGTTLNSIIIPSLSVVGGTVGAIPRVVTITAGTGFTINGTASDSSTYNYLRVG